MAKYKVWIARTFICETTVEAPTRRLAETWVEDDWSVPDCDGRNMDEELWTTRWAIDSGTLVPGAIVTHAFGGVRAG